MLAPGKACPCSRLLTSKDFLLGYYYLLFYHKGSEDVLGFCFRHFRLLELFQFRSRQPCSSNEGFLFVRLEISSAQLCSVFGKHLVIVQLSEFMFASEHCLNTPSEHFFVYKKRRRRQSAAFFLDLCDVLAQSVQAVLKSEHEFRTWNTEHVFPNTEQCSGPQNPILEH